MHSRPRCLIKGRRHAMALTAGDDLVSPGDPGIPTVQLCYGCYGTQHLSWVN